MTSAPGSRTYPRGGADGEGERGHACPGTHTLSIGGLVANTFLYNATHLEDHNYFSALVQ